MKPQYSPVRENAEEGINKSHQVLEEGKQQNSHDPPHTHQISALSS